MKLDCSLEECRTRQDCKCYAYDDGLPEQQFCAYEKNGQLYPCEMGCCGQGCPGSCRDVAFTPPTKRSSPPVTPVLRRNRFYILLLIVIALAVISTLQLVLKGCTSSIKNGNST